MKLLLTLVTLFSLTSFAENNSEQFALRCAPEQSTDAKIFSSDFHWDMSLTEIIEKFVDMYSSEKRLSQRAYWDAQAKQLKLPYTNDRGGDVVITEAFVKTIARHIENAYENKYIDAVMFPDMGHSHLLIKNSLWEKKYQKFEVSQLSRFYEELFADPKLEILYHTAEQLKTRESDGSLVADPATQYRYQTRNIVGLNSEKATLRTLQNSQSTANTVHEVKGYFWWGGGFNMSAQKNGCFEYKKDGHSYFFDLSLFDLVSENPGDDWSLDY